MLAKAEQDGSDWLFPAERGNMCKKRLRDLIKIEMSAIGLPMRPHLFRHAVASLILDHEPTALMRVAALLGDEPATVMRHYAFIERVRLVIEAQKSLLNSMQSGVPRT
jgi:site-specific recombinase XerD